jgi:hypothetical protein
MLKTKESNSKIPDYYLYKKESYLKYFVSLRELITLFQIIYFFVIFIFFSVPILIFVKRKKWGIGPKDVVKNVIYFKELLDNDAYTFHTSRYPFVSSVEQISGRELFEKLNYDFSCRNGFARIVFGPFFLLVAALRVKKFIFFSESSFTASKFRYFDYFILKTFKIKICTIFSGCDSRQREKHIEMSIELGFTSFCNKCKLDCNPLLSKLLNYFHEWGNTVIFNTKDQSGYNTKFIALDGFSSPIVDDSKFEYKFELDDNHVIILHAPSNMNFKGTAYFRDAINRLKSENYDFEYIEVIGKSNKTVLSELQRSHIVLNQLHALVPGHFGVEAMLTGNVVLSSVSHDWNEFISEDCPIIFTNENNVYEQIKSCLENKENLHKIAQSTYRYALKYHSINKNSLSAKRWKYELNNF